MADAEQRRSSIAAEIGSESCNKCRTRLRVNGTDACGDPLNSQMSVPPRTHSRVADRARSRLRATRTRHEGGVGVTARLLALVMLPVTVMCGLSGSAVLSSKSSEGEAQAIDRGVAQLSDLVKLAHALHRLEESARMDVGVEALGIDRSIVTRGLGFDWHDEDAAARTQASRAVVALGPQSPVSRAELQALWADISAGIATTEGSVALLGNQRLDLDAAVSSALTSLEDDSDRGRLAIALRTLDATISMRTIAAAQAKDLTAVWFPAPSVTPVETATALARLNTDTAEYATASARIRRLDVDGVVTGLDGIDADAGVKRFEAAVTSNLVPLMEAGPALEDALAQAEDPLDIASLGETFRGHFRRELLLDRLIATAATEARREAQRLAAADHAALIADAALGSALALVSIAIAVALARSISRPLRELADYAHAINDGRFDARAASMTGKGAREIRVAFGAFADVVATLQLLDAKANALARCDFDDPALTQALHGRLGQLLEGSVTLLSGSIVERDELQTHLAHQATHDALTGIGNRPAAIVSIQDALTRADRLGSTSAVLFIDLNEFKAVNDSHGHESGDEVLRQVASRLTRGLRAGDSLARLGGDEFVIIAEDISDVADAVAIAERVITAISEPIVLANAQVTIGAAVGIALSLGGQEEPLKLLGRADAAMYRAKHNERSSIEIYDVGLQRVLVEREEISAALAAALIDEAGGLGLHYQPVVDAVSGALVGAEALIRWDRPGIGMLAPDSFISIAEKTDLILDVDRWVLAGAASQLVAWSADPDLADIPVAVNISGRHLLSRQLAGHIRSVLDESGLDPTRLSIEITETVLLADLAGKVAIDDFGTGYTSLAHLQKLPIDTIKIDRSFIRQLNERRGISLVRMVNDLAHAIDVDIVAEGVENDYELTVLRAMGADRLQGFLFSPALAPTDFSTWARSRATISV
jgi:diguanylate cyclase (GGDEF)-like protein